MKKKALAKNKAARAKNKEAHKVPNSNKRVPKNVGDKKKKKDKKNKKQLRGHELTIHQPDSPWQIVYGRFKIGGVFTFLHSNVSADRKLYAVVTLAGHALYSVENIFVNNVEATFASASPGWTTSAAFTHASDPKLYRSLQLAGGNNTELAAALPAYWTANHKQQGRAYLYLLLKFHARIEEYSSGLPDFTFVVKGKEVYDPRTTGTAYSNNAVLCALDYLTNTEYGVGATYPDDFDTDNWEDAADVADENVSLAAGGTEKRYTFNAAFDMSETHDNVLDKFETAIAGTICFFNGKWKCFPGKYRTPTVTITQDDIVGPLRITTRLNSNDIFNAVKGRYVDESQGWEVTDAPIVKNSTYQTEDGRQKFIEIDFEGVTSSPTAQRLMKIELEKVRQGIEVSFDMYLGGYELQPEDTVMLTFAEYGWSAKVFVVTDCKLFIKAERCYVTVFLRETASGIYTDSMAETAIDIADNTTLPSPSDIEEPTNVVLTSGTNELEIFADGTIHCRIKVEWDTLTDAFVVDGGYIDCQYRKNSGAWVPATSGPGDSTYMYLPNIVEGATYDVRIRARNYLGFYTDWVTVTGHVAVGKTQAPSNVSGFDAQLLGGMIVFDWTHIADLDRSHYEIRKGASWATATVVANSIIGNTYSYEFQTVGSHVYLIKAYDTTGNVSATASSDTVVIGAPTAPQNITSTIIDNNLILRWTPPSSAPLGIDYYEIYVDSELIGRAYGTFFTYFVSLGGNYDIDIIPVDIGGNAGATGSKSVNMYPPPDYILRDTGTLDIDSAVTFTNCLKSETSEAFVASLVNTETWQEHFVNNSYSTIEDQINDGYPIYAQPAETGDATFEQVIDLGVVVAGSRISFNWTENLLDASVAITPLISYKELIGDSWTDGDVGEVEIHATNFQYVKFQLLIEPTDDSGLVEISQPQYSVHVKKQTDSGNAISSATLPTTITFNLDFLDIDSIVVTAAGDGSTSYNGIYDFTDVPNPTSFDVYVFNTDTGAQVSVPFSWTAEGAINP
jgi:hypothetical protein